MYKSFINKKFKYNPTKTEPCHAKKDISPL